MLNNKPILKTRRQELRNNATPAEKLLWSVLQHSNLGGYKFRRQHSVGMYILDFYCPAEKFAVELDGDSHFTDEAREHDRQRTEYLNGFGIRVIRFLNTDVYDNLQEVCEKIVECLVAHGSTSEDLTTFGPLNLTTPDPLNLTTPGPS